nr:TPA_exp: holocytochrome c synthase [Nothoceros vincentianus]
MGNGRSVEGCRSENIDSRKTVPEKVHELYHKAFPGAGCPVTSESKDKLVSAARNQEQGSSGSGTAGSSGRDGDAQQSGKYKNPHVYDVYGRRIEQQSKAGPGSDVWVMPSFLYYGSDGPEEINPANRMPKYANQAPAPGQREALSKYRQTSSIPKGGTEETWVYPSPQMFYNSLVRKKKAGDVTEEDMEAVVATHNAVNEAAWSRLVRWEKLYTQLFPGSSEHEPRLLHFKGRPHDMSPKAQVMKVLGYGAPFDRHDWTVDRGGREMRYVIDFYYDESSGGKWPFVIDVRPALDSVPAFLLRTRMLFEELMGRSAFPSSLDMHSSTSQTQPDSQQTPAA